MLLPLFSSSSSLIRYRGSATALSSRIFRRKITGTYPSCHQHRRHRQASFRRFATKSGADDNEEWIPPEDSPLRRKIYETEATEIWTNATPAEKLVEVIDLEATLNNKSNQRLLKDDASVRHQTSDYEVLATNVDWDDVLAELNESGEDEMLHKLVQEYGLQDRLNALLRGETQTNNQLLRPQDLIQEQSKEDDEEEGWYDEATFEGLSDEDIIDELIENSPSLTELELEILSQELKRSEEDGRMDFDSMEDIDLNENAQYKDFRAMVWEDYTQKKQKRKESICKKSEISESDFSEYPQNWTDYDSKHAFQRDFLEGNGDNSWTPPSSDFFPSSSYQKKANDNNFDDSDFDDKIDWLEARRSRLKQSNDAPSFLMTPDDAETFRHKKSQIDVIPYTLFTYSELTSSLSAQGATDVRILDVSDYEDLYGVGMGCSYLMVVTGRNSSHIRVLADSIVRNLRARKLNERGVVGASQGVEGGYDIFSNKRSRARASKSGNTNTSARIEDDWMVVDCGNIHVHILEESTRKSLDIESLWNLSDPNSEGSKLRRVNWENEDEVDTYVAENPVPEAYAARMRNEASGGGWMTGDGGRMILPGLFNRKSFSPKWRGCSKNKNKGRRQR